MAVNKRKVLDVARKYAQKGAKEKALKEYNTLLKLDPRDAKLHLEIGDCYRRWGQIDEAVTQYSRVAEQYKADGFDARAVAVFKQILNLDPKLYTAHVSLSELYQRMGLDVEALNALQAAADGYHRDGEKQQALELLRRMATLDPTNTTSRLKVAELLRQEGLEDEAVAEYEAVAAEFTRQGATESFLTAQERILDLRPDRADVLMSIARGLIELKKPERAEPFAKHAVDLEPQNAEIQEILCDVYRVLGNTTELAAATRKLAKVYQDKGDEDKARELMQRIPTELAAGGAGESAMLTDGEPLLDDAPAIPGSGPTDGHGPDDDLEFDDEPGDEGDEFILDDELDDSLDDLDDSGAAAPPLPEGDPEQLFAEASVYLRYGKRDQAIVSLEAVLLQEADHRPALEKLGEAYVELDRNGDAVEVWCRAAELARNDGDDPGFEVLRDRIGAIDAKAAEQLGHAGGAGASAASVDVEADSGFDPDEDVELELDVTVPDDVEVADGNVEAVAEEGIELDLDAGAEAGGVEVAVDGGIEIELDDAETEEDVVVEVDDAVEVDVAVEVDDADAEEDIEIDVDDADAEEVEIDVDAEIEVDVGLDLDDAPTEDAAVSADGSSDPERISEELEEAEFYYQQGLLDEAEAVYRRILKVAPENANALQRIAELAEARGEDPSSAAAPPEPEPEEIAKPKAKKRGKAKSPPAVTEVEAPAAADVEDRTEVADISAEAADDEAVVRIDTPPPPRPGPEVVVVASARDASAERSTQKVAGAVAATSDDTGHFDLAAELRDVLEEDDDDAPGSGPNASAVQSTVEEGLESLFADFKQGVSAALSEDDYETRYDLGIAYREMELYEDAIGEFQLCLESESRKVDSLHLMGLSALDLGRAEDAINHLDQALATPSLADGRRAGIRFDLGRACEARGDLDRARSSYEAVVEHDPDFPGAQGRLDALASGGGGDAAAASSDDGGFESFDDLVADANSDADTQQAESFESFDDVISEAAGEAGSEPEPDAKPGKKRKRKKISFV